jgi:3-deoxy-D-manno-octulosonic-acid transferase
VIAPRHPERAAAIERQLKNLGVRFAVRSRHDIISDDTQIYLADTLGEMGGLMQHAAFVFMGGTLVPVGGHNLLEPAVLGKAIVCGPYLDNFKEEADLLRKADALVEIKNVGELAQVVGQLLGPSKKATERGLAAVNAVIGQTDVLDHYVDALNSFITVD